MELIGEPTGIECEFRLSAISQQDRKSGQGDDPRSEEYSEYMEMCYRVIIFPYKTADSVVRIICQVLQTDGSHLAAALTAGTLALIDAGIPIKDIVVGCSSTILDGRTLVDLASYEELRKFVCGAFAENRKVGEWMEGWLIFYRSCRFSRLSSLCRCGSIAIKKKLLRSLLVFVLHGKATFRWRSSSKYVSRYIEIAYISLGTTLQR